MNKSHNFQNIINKNFFVLKKLSRNNHIFNINNCNFSNKRDKNDKNEEKEIKIEENMSLDEQIGIDEFTNSTTTEKEEKQEKVDNYPLIYYTQPIVPFSKIILNSPNRNDLFFNLVIKYGKLTPIDEETTIIDDITVFFEKEDTIGLGIKSKKEINPHVLGVLCKITYQNKEKLIIEGLDKIYKIKTIRPGKYKFFNPKETSELESSYENNNEYAKEVLNLFNSIISTHEYITKALELETDYFSDNKLSFNFNFEDIKKFLLNQSNTNSNTNTNSSPEHNQLEISNSSNPSEFLSQLNKFSYYFVMKTNTFINTAHNQTQGSTSSEFSKILYLSDLKQKLEKINEIFTNIKNFVNLKYEKYHFPKNFNFPLDQPFKHETEEDLKRIENYKTAVENKISEVDNIEKQKMEFRKKIAEIKSMADEHKKLLEKEINKISASGFDMENSKRVEYLNHIVNLPWDKSDEVVWDLEHAKKVLDGNLYGMKETKERIYEFIAKNMRKQNQKGCVILLTGGPGTGKTRIAKLIGEALKRKVGFVSLAGVSDGKSILGFKRTYVGSTPGMLIREMQHVGKKNPVIVIDEIDKVGFNSYYSNIYYALLQILNPEESHRFTDHYLEIPFDFSKVVFILTSNSEEIFTPLLDRMEVIKIDPYVDYEKFLIMKNFARKQILEDYNFTQLFQDKKFQITDQAIYRIVSEYCKRDAGIRRAKKLLESTIRRVNSKLEINKIIPGEKPMQINSRNVLNILNEPRDEDPILNDMIKNSGNKIGCCIGLFVSKTDQSNSWGSASIFSMSVKEIKKINESKYNMKQTPDVKIKKNANVKITDEIVNDSIVQVNKDKKKKEDVEVAENEDTFEDTLKENTKHSKKSKDNFKISSSGSLGEDSLQSLNIALNVATEFLTRIDPANADFFYKHELHHDCPQILLPKSGPSAGTVIFLCSLSLALKKPLIPNLAMTGEICINGYVLSIGGVKEKAQGAQRFGVKTLVVPIGNKDDFMDCPDNLKDSFERVFFVKNCEEVYNIGFNLDTTSIDCYIPQKHLIDSQSYLEHETLIEDNLVDKLFMK